MKFFNIVTCLALMLPEIAISEAVVATRTIRSQTILVRSDVVLLPGDFPEAIANISDVIGLESKVVLYEGRPIALSDIGPAAVIERNQIVTLIFIRGELLISTEARSLGRAGPGDLLRVMNLASRKTVAGTVSRDGAVIVGNHSVDRFR